MKKFLTSLNFVIWFLAAAFFGSLIGSVYFAHATYIDPSTALNIPGTSGQILFNNTGASSTIVFAPTMSSTTYERIDQYGHLITHGLKPTLTGCTGGTLNTTSNSNSGLITFSGILSLSSCVLTWTATPYPTGSNVQCTVNNIAGVTLGGYTSTLTSLTIPVTVGLGGGSISYQCQGSE